MKSMLDVLDPECTCATLRRYVHSIYISREDVDLCNKTLFVYTMSEDGKFYSKLMEFLGFISNDVFIRILSNGEDAPLDEFKFNIKRNVLFVLNDFGKKEIDFPLYFFDDCTLIVIFLIKNIIQKKYAP